MRALTCLEPEAVVPMTTMIQWEQASIAHLVLVVGEEQAARMSERFVEGRLTAGRSSIGPWRGSSELQPEVAGSSDLPSIGSRLEPAVMVALLENTLTRLEELW